MFVIVQAWSNLPPDVVKNRGIPEGIGLALKHAVSLFKAVCVSACLFVLSSATHFETQKSFQ